MKRLLPVAPILLLIALLLSPAAALSGAKQGLSLWWSSVFPSLLPSFICLKLAQKLGLLRLTARHPKGRLAAVIGFSLVSGAPNGAKLLCALVEEGSLSARNGSRLLPLVNCVSPVFLLSIIASDLLKNKALFQPMAVSIYGCAILLSFRDTADLARRNSFRRAGRFHGGQRRYIGHCGACHAAALTSELSGRYSRLRRPVPGIANFMLLP